MNQLRTLLFVLAGTLGSATWAQDPTAQTFFDKAAREYVKQDKMEALRTLDRGLQQFPGDPKLLKLAEELVKEDQQQQQKQEQKEQQQDQQENQQDKKDQGKKEQEQKDQGKEGQPEKGGEQQPPSGGKPQPGSIAPQDALRMLDALERSEKDVQEKVRVKRRPAVRRSIEKDW